MGTDIGILIGARKCLLLVFRNKHITGDVYFVVQTVLESCWQQLFFYQITKLNSYFMF